MMMCAKKRKLCECGILTLPPNANYGGILQLMLCKRFWRNKNIRSLYLIDEYLKKIKHFIRGRGYIVKGVIKKYILRRRA
jgi:hypothetical protein